MCKKHRSTNTVLFVADGEQKSERNVLLRGRQWSIVCTDKQFSKWRGSKFRVAPEFQNTIIIRKNCEVQNPCGHRPLNLGSGFATVFTQANHMSIMPSSFNRFLSCSIVSRKIRQLPLEHWCNTHFIPQVDSCKPPATFCEPMSMQHVSTLPLFLDRTLTALAFFLRLRVGVLSILMTCRQCRELVVFS